MTMTIDNWLTITLTILIGFFIPIQVFLIRSAIKWTQLVSDVRQLANDSHEDRIATDRRLRWLEENLWKRK
jgi:hypothetical protein